MQWGKRKIIAWSIICLIAGVVVGGYLFSDTQPRSFLALNRCHTQCWKLKDLAGLISSVGIQKAPGILPAVYETDHIVVINYPAPTTPFHQVILLKKDIRDVSDITADDLPYLADVFAYISKAVEQYHLVNYKVVTNGAGLQQMTYLHFHLIGGIDPSAKQ